MFKSGLAFQVKDQTYFLSHLSQSQLRRLLFPLGCISKVVTVSNSMMHFVCFISSFILSSLGVFNYTNISWSKKLGHCYRTYLPSYCAISLRIQEHFYSCYSSPSDGTASHFMSIYYYYFPSDCQVTFSFPPLKLFCCWPSLCPNPTKGIL